MSKPAWWPPEVPYIDPDVQHVGVSALRSLNGTELQSLGDSLYVVQVNEKAGCGPLLLRDVYEKRLVMRWPDRFGSWLAGVIRRHRIAYRRRAVARFRREANISRAMSDAEIEAHIFGDILACGDYKRSLKRGG